MNEPSKGSEFSARALETTTQDRPLMAWGAQGPHALAAGFRQTMSPPCSCAAPLCQAHWGTPSTFCSSTSQSCCPGTSHCRWPPLSQGSRPHSLCWCWDVSSSGGPPGPGTRQAHKQHRHAATTMKAQVAGCGAQTGALAAGCLDQLAHSESPPPGLTVKTDDPSPPGRLGAARSPLTHGACY